ncbi:MAG: RadC family protein [Alphaproteobacteria bacterium]|nr:RadC family protein [Alphaproteobacteria bacterium]
MTTTEEQEEKPDYYGHRARLRERFMVDEGVSMADYELLELLLMMAIPRRDVKPYAKRLIKNFGDLRTVLHTPAHKLLSVCNLPPVGIVMLRLLHACILRASYDASTVSDQPALRSWEYFKEFCWNNLAFKEVEEVWVYFFDDVFHHKGEKHLSTGTINKAVFHQREILRVAIDNGASIIVLVHNHPSGSFKPSDFDKAVTKELEELCEMFDLELFDHLIVAQEGIYSFREYGLIEAKQRSEDSTGRYDKKLAAEKQKKKSKK